VDFFNRYGSTQIVYFFLYEFWQIVYFNALGHFIQVIKFVGMELLIILLIFLITMESIVMFPFNFSFFLPMVFNLLFS
jgi:hypothetical protein